MNSKNYSNVMTPFTEFIQTLFAENKTQLPYTEEVAKIREEGLRTFSEKDFVVFKKENKEIFEKSIANSTNWQLQLTTPAYRPVEEYFKCKVENIDSQMFFFQNGWFVNDGKRLFVNEKGVIIGSLFAALEQYPLLVLPYLTEHPSEKEDTLSALNRMLFSDGLFVYVPDNVVVERPVQLISLIDSNQDLLLNNRNLIIVGKNAQLTFIQCDDSIHFKKSFINNVTKTYLDESAKFFYYKMENKDAESLLFNELEVMQKAHSEFYSNAMTFNAGYIRNRLNVYLKEPFSRANLYGLYLVDKKQHVDSQIFVNHQMPDCESHQLYKGIVDESATAHFLGHVLVRPDAQRTMANQTNRNIALTDEAHITSKPFLEIYADDVKCNHGTTVGQLDEEAMYYIRTRGICEHSARKLLMFAFANEIADFILIDSLKARYKEMIRKRLNGELTICDHCVLHCPYVHE